MHVFFRFWCHTKNGAFSQMPQVGLQPPRTKTSGLISLLVPTCARWNLKKGEIDIAEATTPCCLLSCCAQNAAKCAPKKKVRGGRPKWAVGVSGPPYLAQAPCTHPMGRCSTLVGWVGRFIARVASFSMIFSIFPPYKKQSFLPWATKRSLLGIGMGCNFTVHRSGSTQRDFHAL